MTPEEKSRIRAILAAPIEAAWYPYLYGWLAQSLAHQGVVHIDDFEAALASVKREFEARVS
jgi:hypothetical protein